MRAGVALLLVAAVCSTNGSVALSKHMWELPERASPEDGEHSVKPLAEVIHGSQQSMGESVESARSAIDDTCATKANAEQTIKWACHNLNRDELDTCAFRKTNTAISCSNFCDSIGYKCRNTLYLNSGGSSSANGCDLTNRVHCSQRNGWACECSAACDASAAPTHGDKGGCTATLASGSTCKPTCDEGYTVSGTSSCSAGTLSAATCEPNGERELNVAALTSAEIVAILRKLPMASCPAGFIPCQGTNCNDHREFKHSAMIGKTWHCKCATCYGCEADGKTNVDVLARFEAHSTSEGQLLEAVNVFLDSRYQDALLLSCTDNGQTKDCLSSIAGEAGTCDRLLRLGTAGAQRPPTTNSLKLGAAAATGGSCVDHRWRIKGRYCSYYKGRGYCQNPNKRWRGRSIKNVWCKKTCDSCPIDCQVGDWAEWTGCSSEGKRTRSRSVSTQSANGGAACPSLKESQSCFLDEAGVPAGKCKCPSLAATEVGFYNSYPCVPWYAENHNVGLCSPNCQQSIRDNNLCYSQGNTASSRRKLLSFPDSIHVQANQWCDRMIAQHHIFGFDSSKTPSEWESLFEAKLFDSMRGDVCAKCFQPGLEQSITESFRKTNVYRNYRHVERVERIVGGMESSKFMFELKSGSNEAGEIKCPHVVVRLRFPGTSEESAAKYYLLLSKATPETDLQKHPIMLSSVMGLAGSGSCADRPDGTCLGNQQDGWLKSTCSYASSWCTDNTWGAEARRCCPFTCNNCPGRKGGRSLLMSASSKTKYSLSSDKTGKTDLPPDVIFTTFEPHVRKALNEVRFEVLHRVLTDLESRNAATKAHSPGMSTMRTLGEISSKPGQCTGRSCCSLATAFTACPVGVIGDGKATSTKAGNTNAGMPCAAKASNSIRAAFKQCGLKIPGEVL